MRKDTGTTFNATDGSALSFPFDVPPAAGEVREVAPGLLWARIALPFLLDHVNVYLIEDGEGWAIFDTGIANTATRDAWEALFAGPLAGFRFTRLIVSHYHPDHIGLAGWLCARLGIPMLTSQTSYLGCINISLDPGALGDTIYRDFYRRHGLSDETAELVATQGHGYLRMVEKLPRTFRRIVEGDQLRIGARTFHVLSGDGHAPEQIMLFSPQDGLFLAADTVIAGISPNIGVWAVDPEGDPLGLYLRCLRRLETELPSNVLVLPGHKLPFYGLHSRCRELAEHHDIRCRMIVEACRAAPRTVAELVPVLFTRKLDAHQLSFAFSEAHAHANHMVAVGELAWQDDGDRLRLEQA